MGYDEKLALYKTAVSKCKAFDLKGKTMPYTSANGHMFSQLNKKGELGIRFSQQVQERYMVEWSSGHFLSYGAKMRGYVLVPERFWDDLDAMATFLQEGYEYVMSLDPK
ncbi:MAG: hypothetical protein AAGA85_22270 [Bacteroidota bacterium]